MTNQNGKKPNYYAGNVGDPLGIADQFNQPPVTPDPTQSSPHRRRSGSSTSSSSTSTQQQPPPSTPDPKKLPPPLPRDQNIYDLGYAQRDKTDKEMTGYVRAAEQTNKQTQMIPKKQELSTQEYLQRVYDADQNLDRQMQDAQQLKEWKPDAEAEYYTIPEKDYDPRFIHGPGSKRETALDLYPDKPGVQLTPEQTQTYMQNLGRETDTYLQSMKQQSQAAYIQALNLPKDTVVKETDKGYEFELRDTSLDWTKNELRKIDKAYEINPLLGGVAEFGFGAVSGFAALAKPLAGYTLEKLGYDVKPVHYVSPMDIAFEPIGWSPKGSTEILKSRPVFSAGGLASEYLQTVAMGKAASLTASGVAKGTKAAVKSASALGKRFQPIGQFTGKIGGTATGKNIYNWAVKGYKPVYGLAPRSSTPIYKKTVNEPLETLITGGTKIEKGKLLTRTFVSPDDYLKAQKALQSQLGKRTDIMFPKSSQMEATTFLSEGKIKGLFRKRLITDQRAVTTRYTQPMIARNIDDYIIKGMPQTKTKMILGVDDIGDYMTRLNPYDVSYRYFPDDTFTVTTRGKIGDVSTMMTSKERIGYMLPKQADEPAWLTYKKTVQPIQVIPGTRATKLDFYTGPSLDDPMKAWAKAAQKHYDQPFKQSAFQRFLKGEQGSLEIIPQVSIIRQPKTLSWTRKPLSHETFTSFIPVRTSTLPASLASFTGMKLGAGIRSSRELQNIQIGLLHQSEAMRQDSDELWRRAQRLERTQKMDTGQISMQDSASLNLSASLQDTMQKTQQELTMMPIQRTSTYTPVFKVPSAAYTPSKMYTPIPFRFSFNDKEPLEKQIRPVWFGAKGYRERQWKTITMSDILGLQRKLRG